MVIAGGQVTAEPEGATSPKVDFAFLLSLSEDKDRLPLPLDIIAIYTVYFTNPAPRRKQELDEGMLQRRLARVSEQLKFLKR